MKSSDFIFGCVNLLHKVNLKHGGSYVGSPDWVKHKKAKVNPNEDDKCFQHAAAVEINHEEIVKKFAKNIKN